MYKNILQLQIESNMKDLFTVALKLKRNEAGSQKTQVQRENS